MRIKNIISKKVAGGFLAALLLISSGLSFLPYLMPQAAAAGETYTWQDYQHVQISGGALMQPSILSRTASPSTLAYTNTQLTVHGTDNTGKTNTLCNIDLTLTASPSNPASGSVQATPSPPVEYSGGGGSRTACSQGTATSFDGLVTIQGKYTPPSPGGGETLAQKIVNVTVYSPKPLNSSPSSITVTYTDSKTRQGSVSLTKDTQYVGAQDTQVAVYQTTIYLDAGNYKFCADVFSLCSSLQKKTGVPTSVVLGEPSTSNQVGVNVVLTLATAGGTPTVNIPALTIHLEDTNGNDVTAPKSTNPVNTPGQEVGGTVSNDTIHLDEVWFDSISPGKYKACVEELKACSNVFVKTAGEQAQVTITADGTKVNGTGNTSSTPRCEAGWGFDWVFCKIYNGIAYSTDWVFQNMVKPYLTTPPLCLNPQGTNCVGLPKDQHGHPFNMTYTVWSTFRIYADIFLVIALLVIVFGQSLGGGLIEAYTAKKVLPRLLAAAILINLSIYIVAFLIDVTNIVGGSIGYLLTAPLSSNGFFNITPQGFGGAGVTLGIIAALGLKSASIWALASFEGLSMIMTTIIFPALLIVLAILATVAIRQAIIMILIFVSPVAFALYCLPNTEKYFKKWWDVLVEMMMVYPIIVVLFAVGNILSVTVENAKPGGPVTNLVNAVLSLVFLIAPLAMIPFAFRIAGGVIGKIHDALMTGRQKVQGMTEERRNRAKHAYQRKVVSRRGDMYNSAPARMLGHTPGFRYAMGRREQTVAQQVHMLGDEFMKDPKAATIQHDDNALRAATYRSYGDAVRGLRAAGIDEEEARRAARAAQTSVGFGRSQGVWAAQQMAATGTAYGNLEDAAATIARVAGGDETTLSSLAGNINSVTKSVGRMDIAPGYGTLRSLALAEGGMGGFRDSQNNPTTRAQAYYEATRSAWNSSDLSTLVRGKDATQTRRFANHVLDRFRNGSDEEKRDAAVMLAELQQALPTATGGNQVVINETIRAAGIDHEDRAWRAAQAQRQNTARGLRPGDMGYATADSVAGRTIETQISDILHSGYGIDMSPEVIRGRERAYDNTVPRGERGGGAGAGAPPPPPGGTPPAGGTP